MEAFDALWADVEMGWPAALEVGEWKRTVRMLGLSPQQARIVWLILEGKRDKQIAAKMEVGIATVRTHLARLFVKARVADRVELVLKVFACARSEDGGEGCHLK
jgi:DNA-binding CsgD family transcriptional regulator